MLLVLIPLRTNLTTRALATRFDTSQTALDPINHHLVPVLARTLRPDPDNSNHPWIIDGTLIPVHDQSVTAIRKNYRRSVNAVGVVVEYAATQLDCPDLGLWGAAALRARVRAHPSDADEVVGQCLSRSFEFVVDDGRGAGLSAPIGWGHPGAGKSLSATSCTGGGGWVARAPAGVVLARHAERSHHYEHGLLGQRRSSRLMVWPLVCANRGQGAWHLPPVRVLR